MIKSFITTFFLITITATTLFAQENYVKKPNAQTVNNQGFPINQRVGSAYSHPARIDVVNSRDLFVEGSFIYWTPLQQGLEFGMLNHTSGTDTTGQIVNFSFKSKPGFKVKLGKHFEFDDWKIYAQYTRLHSKMSKTQIRPDEYQSIDVYWVNETPTDVFQVSGKWKLEYDIIDLDLSRPYYNGKNLILKAFYGLKSGWINQNCLFTALLADGFNQENAKSRSWLIGPKAGVDSNWLLGNGLRIFGDFTFSLLYQHLKAEKVAERITTSTAQRNIRDYTLKQIAPHASLFLGMGAGSYINNQRHLIDLSCGFEIQYYWNQNLMSKLNNLTVGRIRTSLEDLMFYGLNATLRFDF